MICRNSERGKVAQEEVKKYSGNDNVHLHICDVSLQSDIKDFVNKFTSEEKRLDCLVNNAGVLIHERKKTKEGIESIFATNTLGTFLLTELLVPFMQQNKDNKPRVVSVSSGGMYTQKLNTDYQFEKMNPYDGVAAYAYTKRHQVILNEMWAAKYKEIDFYCMHPGWSDTEGVQSSLKSFRETFEKSLRTPEEGADTIVYLAITEKKLQNGAFYFDREPTNTHLTLGYTEETEQERKEFYDYCKKITQLN